jgi:hypothetical protein
MKNISFAFRGLLLILLTSFILSAQAQQLNVVGAEVSSYNVSPRGLCQVTIMCTLPSVQVIMQTQLLDAANEPLVTVKTNPFTLHNGMNIAAAMNFSISSVEYGTTAVVSYIRNSNVLPTGKYNYCVKLIAMGNVEAGDEYCQELESDLNTYLYLISPEDKDTINTLYPVLIWNHSDPFNTLGPGEYYRMMVAPLNQGQSPDEAIAVNTPVFLKNNLEENQVQYPFDAPTLVPGNHYAWQVELIEAKNVVPVDVKYAIVKMKVDGSFYPVVNNRIFFKFDESYATSDVAECVIYDTRMEPVKSKVQDASKNTDAIALKRQGYNQYEVDLSEMNVSSGFYYLHVKNGKGQSFMLKFLIN